MTCCGRRDREGAASARGSSGWSCDERQRTECGSEPEFLGLTRSAALAVAWPAASRSRGGAAAPSSHPRDESHGRGRVSGPIAHGNASRWTGGPTRAGAGRRGRRPALRSATTRAVDRTVTRVRLIVCSRRSARWLIVTATGSLRVRAARARPRELSRSVTVRVAPAASVNRAVVTVRRRAVPVTWPLQVPPVQRTVNRTRLPRTATGLRTIVSRGAAVAAAPALGGADARRAPAVAGGVVSPAAACSASP